MHMKNQRSDVRGTARTCVLFLFVFVAICVATEHARAANLTVNCDKNKTIHAALGLLAATNPEGPNTITVLGSCKENVVVQRLDRLTLITKTGASISDSSGGTLAVVDIESSQNVTLQGFTINGGVDGVACTTASVCYLTGNTVQSSVGQEAVLVVGGSRAFLATNLIQNNTQRGLTIANGSQAFSAEDTFQGNADAAIVANSGAYLTATSAIVQNNGSDGSDAIIASDHSALRLISCTITGNSGSGVRLQHSAEARFDNYVGPTTVTGNGGTGVFVRDLSFALFGPSTITGNLSGTDVTCSPQFPATRGALTNIGGGMTNCVEP